MNAPAPPAMDRDALLARRMQSLGVRETDLVETFVRSAGPGGQNVNKTATCVLLVHRPTGISVRCQITRHQGQNRYLARIALLDKLLAHRRAETARVRALREKERRRNRPRSRAAKDRMLADKCRHAAKKLARRPVGPD